MSQLKRALLQAYSSSFSDKRIKRLERGHLFIVDDRKDEDFGADGHLYPWFCKIFADVISEDELTVSLHGVPVSRQIEEWAEKTGTAVEGGTMTLKLQRGQQSLLSDLAIRVRAIVARGARYEVNSYKYVCPRVARSLDRLKVGLARWSMATWIEGAGREGPVLTQGIMQFRFQSSPLPARR